MRLFAFDCDLMWFWIAIHAQKTRKAICRLISIISVCSKNFEIGFQLTRLLLASTGKIGEKLVMYVFSSLVHSRIRICALSFINSANNKYPYYVNSVLTYFLHLVLQLIYSARLWHSFFFLYCFFCRSFFCVLEKWMNTWLMTTNCNRYCVLLSFLPVFFMVRVKLCMRVCDVLLMLLLYSILSRFAVLRALYV